nr:hypothetical protein [Nonomuraea cypriaca]
MKAYMSRMFSSPFAAQWIVADDGQAVLGEALESLEFGHLRAKSAGEDVLGQPVAVASCSRQAKSLHQARLFKPVQCDADTALGDGQFFAQGGGVRAVVVGDEQHAHDSSGGPAQPEPFEIQPGFLR